MRDALLKRYHQLPAPLRSAAATLRGSYLRVWRYSSGTERLCEEAHVREQWSAGQWRAWQEERLAFMLHRAVTRVPYYRDQWSARRRRGDRTSYEYIENWPVLEKESVRQHPRAFVADDRNPARMFREHTSGTTGKSLDLWWSRETVRTWYALYEARCRHWYGVSRRDRWAILGGQLVVPAAQQQPPFWVWNGALRQLYMSAYHIAPAVVRDYVMALQRYRISFVLAYPSALYPIAREVLAQGLDTPRLTVAIANAEPVLDHQREVISQAFGCALRETYGMSEIVAAASECEHGRMHLWPEVGWLEVFEQGQQVNASASGDFVCTSLLNVDMPLVRYRVGDRGALPTASTPCPCNRHLPELASIEGRIDDVLYTPDGRIVGRMDPVFKSELPIREAQIVQESLDRVRIRYVAAPGYTASHGRTVTERVRDRLGAVTVELEEVEAIPRSANGKFRAVICNLTPEERAWVRAQ